MWTDLTRFLRLLLGTSIAHLQDIYSSPGVTHNICSLILTTSALVLGDNIPRVNQIKRDNDDDDEDDRAKIQSTYSRHLNFSASSHCGQYAG